MISPLQPLMSPCNYLVMQYSMAATECFQFLWRENISISNNRDAMIRSSPPAHLQCRDSPDHQPRRHSYRVKPFHCQHCLVLQSSLIMSGCEVEISELSESLRGVRRQLPECESHRCRLLQLLPFLSLSREDETFLPRTEFHQSVPAQVRAVDKLIQDSHSERLSSLLLR